MRQRAGFEGIAIAGASVQNVMTRDSDKLFGRTVIQALRIVDLARSRLP
jgi:hypothetical protein